MKFNTEVLRLDEHEYRHAQEIAVELGKCFNRDFYNLLNNNGSHNLRFQTVIQELITRFLLAGFNTQLKILGAGVEDRATIIGRLMAVVIEDTDFEKGVSFGIPKELRVDEKPN